MHLVETSLVLVLVLVLDFWFWKSPFYMTKIEDEGPGRARTGDDGE